MAKDRDQELVNKYKKLLESVEESSANVIERNKMCAELFLHGSKEDIDRLVKEHNRRTILINEQGETTLDESTLCETFLREYGHTKDMFRYIKDGKIFYGPKEKDESTKVREEYAIPSDAKFDGNHFIKSKRKREEFDSIMLEMIESGFQIVYESGYDYIGTPHTEYILYYPMYNAVMHLEFDVKEELVPNKNSEGLIMFIPYIPNGKTKPAITTFGATQNIFKDLEKMSGDRKIASTFPLVGSDFQHFTNRRDGEMIKSPAFSPDEVTRLRTLISLGKLAASDEPLKDGFGSENTCLLSTASTYVRPLIKIA